MSPVSLFKTMANVITNFVVLMWSMVVLAGLLAMFVLSLSHRSNRSRFYILSVVRIQPVPTPQPAPRPREPYNLRPMVQYFRVCDNNNS